MLAFAVAVSIPLAVMPVAGGVFVFSWLAMAGFGVAALLRPTFLLYFIVLSSAVAGLFRVGETEAVEGVSMTLSGLRWVGIAALAGLVLLVRWRDVRVPPAYLPLIGLCAWMALRLVTAVRAGSGIKDVFFYALPVVVGLYCRVALPRDDPRALSRFSATVQYSILIPAVLYAVTIPLGLVEITDAGPKGIVGPRPLSTYLLIALCLCLATWRYPGSRSERSRSRLLALVAVGIVLFTGSRASALLAVSILALFRADPRRLRSALPRLVAAVVVVTAVFASIPLLRERIFFTMPRTLEEVPRLLNTSGRRGFWGVTLESARLRPLTGWGPGSARRVVAANNTWSVRSRPKEYPPHNEYLQVFHDGGAIALAMLFAGWTALTIRYWRAWRAALARGSLLGTRWAWAVMLALAVVLASAVVDNTLHYAHVMAPLFLYMAIADRTASRDRPPIVRAPADGAPVATGS